MGLRQSLADLDTKVLGPPRPLSRPIWVRLGTSLVSVCGVFGVTRAIRFGILEPLALVLLAIAVTAAAFVLRWEWRHRG